MKFEVGDKVISIADRKKYDITRKGNGDGIVTQVNTNSMFVKWTDKNEGEHTEFEVEMQYFELKDKTGPTNKEKFNEAFSGL